VPKPSRIPPRESSPETAPTERVSSVSGAAVESLPPRVRRSFSASEKLRIVRAADACLASGERGAVEALLRQEGIYSSLLSAWRVQLNAHGAKGLEARKPGRKPKFDAKDVRIAAQEKRIAQLERRMYIADALIELQKKAHLLLGIALPESDEKI
jgi:transposase